MITDVVSLYTMSIRLRICDVRLDGKHSVMCLTIKSWMNMVERIGIEPMTPCLQSRCSPS